MTRTTAAPARRARILTAISAACLLVTGVAVRTDAQVQAAARPNPLAEASGSIEALVARVSAAWCRSR